MDSAPLDDEVLKIGFVLARAGRDIALAAEAPSDIRRELACSHDPVAIVVRPAGQSGAKEIGQEAPGLELARDKAGQILLGAEQSDDVGPVDQVAEATGKA